MFARYTVLMKMLSDVFIYIIADNNENECLLASVLDCIVDCISLLAPSKKTSLDNAMLIENFPCLILIIDEIIHNG